MAVVEAEGGARSPAPEEEEERRPLRHWDGGPVMAQAVPKTKPTPAPAPAGRFDATRLRDLTAYTMPAKETTSAPLTPGTGSGAWATYGKERSENPDATGGNWRTFGPEMADLMAAQKRDESADPQPKEVQRQALKLSWDDYNKLSDEKRAAVDFNTLLVQAREKDLNTDYKPTEAQQEHFQEESAKMFGEGRGSETFAPETLAVLKQIDFKADGSEDLDNFLGLKSAISAKDLKGFSFDKVAMPPLTAQGAAQPDVLRAISPGGAGGLETEQRAGVYTQNLQASMVRANELLQTWRAGAARNRNDEVLGLGGLTNDVRQAQGYRDKPQFVDADRDGVADNSNFSGFLQDTLAGLANANMDPATAFDAMKKTLKPDEMQAAMKYFDEQTRAAARAGSGVFGLQGKGTRNPVEIRKLLGLDGGS